ncbi:hypothetical protein NA57DRAFT_20564, partial [Rhizodiscina lignyota]
TAAVGSPGAVDILDEDVERDDRARATGYLGKSSDVQWLRKARERRLGDPVEDGGAGPYGPPSTPGVIMSPRRDKLRRGSADPPEPLTAATYHLDDQDMLPNQPVDAYEMPTRETAHTLFDLFMRNANSDFLFIDNSATADQMMSTLHAAQRQHREQLESQHRAILNIIFAIGASYAHLTGDAQGGNRDHILYFTRARMLALDGDIFVRHPTYHSVQLTALTGFYYLCSSQVSRAWMVSSYAVRAAFALGLHIRNEDPNLPELEKEARVRLWWALWLLERHLVALSGRPTALDDRHCSVPRPTAANVSNFLSFDAHRSENIARQYFTLRIDLAKVVQDAIDTLYSPSIVKSYWSTVQVHIQGLENDLRRWRDRVPAALEFNAMERVGREYVRAARTLGFHYCMSRIMIYRPCLCPLDRRLEGQSDRSSQFNREAAKLCVAAAEDLIDLLPNGSDPEFIDPVQLYQEGPWYDQVNLIMRASAVIMVDISLETSHSNGGMQRLASSITKLVAWLREMAKHNAAAYRAWETCIDLI